MEAPVPRPRAAPTGGAAGCLAWRPCCYVSLEEEGTKKLSELRVDAPEVNNFFLKSSSALYGQRTFSFFPTCEPALSLILRDILHLGGSVAVLKHGLKCFDVLSTEGEASLPLTVEGSVTALTNRRWWNWPLSLGIKGFVYQNTCS